MSPIKSALVTLLALPALTLSAQAQTAPEMPVSVEDGQLVYKALGHRLAWPLPDWVPATEAAPDGLDQFVTSSASEAAEQASLELFPKGESEAYWTTLYGARITARGDTALSQLRQAVVNVYARACKPETVALFQLEPDMGDAIPPLGFLCGSYLDELPAYAGKGEVMVIGFVRSQAGVGMVYQEWRGAAFDPQDTATWPVSPEVLESRVAQFKSEVTLTPAD